LPPWLSKKVLITVRTYPSPARKGIEVSCTAGVTDQREWIRLFPVPYRFLDDDKRFKRYQWVEVRALRATDDARPESYKLDIDSIKIVSDPIPPQPNKWQARKDLVYPLRSPSLCWLQETRDRQHYPTLGIFRPAEITRLIMEPDAATWTPDQLARLRQHTLFNKMPATELEKIPFRFKYEFRCEASGCPGHSLTCTDWELGQSYRRYRREYGADLWETKFRDRFEKDMIEKNDTHFYVGTLHHHPNIWIIVGLFYPRK
jgi:hypothetical protein